MISFAVKVRNHCWIQSVPPAVAGGSTVGIQNCLKDRMLIVYPPATAGGTDCIQARSSDFEVSCK